MLGETIGML